MRRWTLVVIVLLFLGLAVAAVGQYLAGHKGVSCPGPKAQFGRGRDIVRCVNGTPTVAPSPS